MSARRAGRGAARPTPSPERPLPPWSVPLVVGAGLILYLVATYGDIFAIPFITDDHIFLDKVRGASFLSLWEPRGLFAGYYRPWAREFHYWLFDRVGGGREWPFHLASAMLWLAAMLFYFALARRVAGLRAAIVATFGSAALAAFGVPLVWIAGAQDLWMLAAGLAFLYGFANGRQWLAAASLAVALASKETAACLPAIAVAYAVIVDRQSPRATARRLAPHALVLLCWGLLHPLLLGRLWSPILASVQHQPQSLLTVLLITPLAALNLDKIPAPDRGWPRALLQALPGAVALGLALAAAFAIASRQGAPGGIPVTPSPEPRQGGARRAWQWGLVWALLAWAPLATPWLGWHAYYTLLGALGAWLAIGVALRDRPRLAFAIVVALVMLRTPRAVTRDADLGSERYHRRVATLTRDARSSMLQLYPTLAPGTRVFLAQFPGGTNLIAGAGESPALRVWYRDPKLRANYMTHYRPRAPGDTLGRDLFLRWNGSRWNEIVRGAEDLTRGQRSDPQWADSHDILTLVLFKAGDVEGARIELEKLVTLFPERFGYAFNLGVAHEALGDSAVAGRWYVRAASLPGATDDVRAAARRYPGAGHRTR